MIISCPECATKFGVPADALGSDERLRMIGRKVRCAKCSHVWMANVGDAIDDEEAKPATPTPTYKAPPAPKKNDEVNEAEVKTPSVEETSEKESSETKTSATQEPAKEAPAEDPDIKDLGSSSVEEALAVIKGSEFEEPDFPLEKGQISESIFAPTKKLMLIGWGALGTLLFTLIMVFALMQQTLEEAWPPMTKIYGIFGMSGDANYHEEEVAEKIDYSQFINITNEASVALQPDGSQALVISGSVTNTADFDIELPMVEAVLRNERRMDIYVWSFRFDETILKAGKTMPFSETVRGTPQETTEYELMLLWEE